MELAIFAGILLGLVLVILAIVRLVTPRHETLPVAPSPPLAHPGLPTYEVHTEHRETGQPGPVMTVPAASEVEAYAKYEGTTLRPVAIRLVALSAPSQSMATPQVVHVHHRSSSPHGDWYNGPWGSVVRIAILLILLSGGAICLIPALFTH